jgi:hypothetical protein
MQITQAPQNALFTVFGLLEPTPPKSPRGEVQKTFKLDSLRVSEYRNVLACECACGRSEAILLAPQDYKKITRLNQLYACPLCIQEFKDAKTTKEKLEVWLTQNKREIEAQQHLYLPKHTKILFDTRSGTTIRTKRAVYQAFFEKPLAADHFVLSKCNDEFCINPYHLMLSRSPAGKITPEMKSDVVLWSSTLGWSTLKIQHQIQQKYGRSVSKRSISSIKRSWHPSNAMKMS